MDKYDEMAAKIVNMTATMPSDRAAAIHNVAIFGRQCAAEAYRDAARDVQCFDWEKGSQTCEPCDDCVQAARLRGKAAALDKSEGGA